MFTIFHKDHKNMWAKSPETELCSDENGTLPNGFILLRSVCVWCARFQTNVSDRCVAEKPSLNRRGLGCESWPPLLLNCQLLTQLERKMVNEATSLPMSSH